MIDHVDSLLPKPADLQPTRTRGQSRVSRYTQETGIDLTYGEKTWRPVQSVIDLVQNHLDANTTIYEKRLLEAAGWLGDYDPTNNLQLHAIALVSRMKYSDNQN